MDDLRLLRVFREVARRGSFSAAAAALAYTQPAVSQQVARLERQLGVRLIDRGPRELRLTPAGEALLRHVERVLAQLAEAEAEIAEIAEGARGRVRVVSFPTAAGTFVGRALAAFRRDRPEVEVGLEIALPRAAVARLRRGEAEIAISQEGGFGADPDHSGLRAEHLLDDPLDAALPVGHELAARRTVALADLARDPLILIEPPGELPEDNVVVRAFREAGAEPRVAQRAEDHFAVEGLVASGMGVALLPRLALASTRCDVEIRPLRGRAPRRRVLAVTDAEPAPATRALLDALRTAAAAHATP